MRKILLGVLGLLLIVFAIFFAKYLIENKDKPTGNVQKVVKTVFVDTVENKDVPIVIKNNGNLMAKHRIELYSEVQGVFLRSSKLFKEGQKYSKGSVLLRMDGAEFGASVQSQKSNLVNLITSIMPDLRLDYPEAYPKWQAYLNNFDMKKATPPLPESTSAQVNNFIIGRGINTAYYNVKNLEERLRKYTIVAPFNGVLTEALVNEGTLVRNGQKMGEFIDPSVYEMEVAINKSYSRFLSVGKAVTLSNLEHTQQWKGKVSRINGKVDQATQTVKIFIEAQGEGMKEGMYLEASLIAKDEADAIKIDRSLMVDGTHVYAVKDTVLQLVEATPVFYSDKEVVLKGIENGTKIITKPVPGAFPGMVVKVAETDTKSVISNTKQAVE
ncbi:HlyD family efflux transporter periplasmic adaptor subunit [Galbibacter sp. EGI 63066]|uniref:efflux RND transporter periplasmic adaptor subunit n=1 Tax=Galbibacter sp. EGI 63066 TaxID=2993559 RepID=UPI0022491C98|nr:HlyD family efflux transporter periplasmic adaptor subunit [Galbibacter sp. EGI 63066]MCX2679992.1 HlyD family efflux transporter periplasmic adaptor subunit [Galbibacter sp. EGI 63066]